MSQIQTPEIVTNPTTAESTNDTDVIDDFSTDTTLEDGVAAAETPTETPATPATPEPAKPEFDKVRQQAQQEAANATAPLRKQIEDLTALVTALVSGKQAPAAPQIQEQAQTTTGATLAPEHVQALKELMTKDGDTYDFSDSKYPKAQAAAALFLIEQGELARKFQETQVEAQKVQAFTGEKQKFVQEYATASGLPTSQVTTMLAEFDTQSKDLISPSLNKAQADYIRDTIWAQIESKHAKTPAPATPAATPGKAPSKTVIPAVAKPGVKTPTQVGPRVINKSATSVPVPEQRQRVSLEGNIGD